MSEIVDQAPSAPVTSRTQASCGRIVHVHMPKLYGGVRPAIVLRTEEDGAVACNVQLTNGGNGDDVRTMTMLCNLYDPLTDEQRQFLACSLECWAEWMPYQKGQAAKTDELTPRVANLEKLILAYDATSLLTSEDRLIDVEGRLARVEAILHKYLKAAGANELAAELRGGE